MFRHLLLPSDGSKRSEAAIKAGVALAFETGARITGLTVANKINVLDEDLALLEAEAIAQHARQAATAVLDGIEREARCFGIPFEGIYLFDQEPYRAIIEVARRRDCDLIFMASRRHHGLRSALFGSVARKVMTHCDIPVLVYGGDRPSRGVLRPRRRRLGPWPSDLPWTEYLAGV